ncbi:MAG: YHS domain-containing protein [Deltaproteobacteria bacterium]|nr:YHS domain-containing protein [Deltaproteobacteria bacterium]
MIRFFILAITSYLGFKLVQKVASRFFSQKIPCPQTKPEVESEELVQDPVCKVFVPRRNALKAQKNGEDFFFCSEGCRKKFLR